MKLNYAIVFVTDMRRAVSFYRDVLGIPLKFESPGWSELATEGATLALHSTAVSHPGGDAPAQEPPGRCRPGFSVPDLDSFHARMIEFKVACTQQPTETFGARVAQYVDPDGLVISVAEARRLEIRDSPEFRS
ncbi:MAG: VOC family protein [Acidobacteriia bacterium]|nr:VOC family protein [Terriglobia bacterium]